MSTLNLRLELRFCDLITEDNMCSVGWVIWWKKVVTFELYPHTQQNRLIENRHLLQVVRMILKCIDWKLFGALGLQGCLWFVHVLDTKSTRDSHMCLRWLFIQLKGIQMFYPLSQLELSLQMLPPFKYYL